MTDTAVSFSKEEFKKKVVSNCKSLYRKNIDEADKQQVFQSVAYAVKDLIIDKWIATHKTYDKEDPKVVYYMSMEFLMGRALGNNMINLTKYNEIKEALVLFQHQYFLHCHTRYICHEQLLRSVL